MTERTWTLPEPRERLTRKQYAELYLRQDGRCPECLQRLEIKGGKPVCVDEHINPLWRGGTNELNNRELWCEPCTKPKTAKEATDRAKGLRVRDKFIGAPKVKKGRGFPTKEERLRAKQRQQEYAERRT
jgi:5-methylcytosine-specific restriction endonuclease McrA